MKFTCEIFRTTDPNTAHPVVVEYNSFHHEGFPTTLAEVTLEVRTDLDADGVPDTQLTIPHRDFSPRLSVPSSLYGGVDARMTGTGNMMATIRARAKQLVTDHNTAVNPTGIAAAPVDLDTDSV